jgi:uncharacterized Fe-S center protein
MKSKVYFMDFRSRRKKENKNNKLLRLFDAVGGSEIISKGDLTAVKLHFGERGGDGFIRPIFVRPIVDKIKESGGKPFLTDTNTLYSGSRKNSVDHLNTAHEHGFTPLVTGAPILIADGIKSDNFCVVELGLKHFSFARIASDIVNADAMVVLSHFKGHEMAGFGGSIKNIAMGCAPAIGKRDQHSTRPKVEAEKCIGCEACINVCPEGAIENIEGKAFIHEAKCIGCGECITVCPVQAIELDQWGSEARDFIEKMAEYAYGAVKEKKGKTIYFNFLMDITPDCDCVPWSDAPIVPNIGILASTDPVAIDKASLDLVNEEPALKHSMLNDRAGGELPCGEDHFKSMRKGTYGELQISYGESIGLGSSDYELIKL